MAKKHEDQQQSDPALEQQGGKLTDQAGEGQTDGAVDPVAGKVAELEAANAALTAKNAATEEQLAKALARLDALEAKAAAPAAGSPAPIVANPAALDETPYQKQLRIANERRARFYQRLEQAEAALQDGPNKYQISLEGENRMTRIVGAASEFEAEAKYKAYFGIRSTKKNLSVSLIEGEAQAAAEGAGTLA